VISELQEQYGKSLKVQVSKVYPIQLQGLPYAARMSAQYAAKGQPAEYAMRQAGVGLEFEEPPLPAGHAFFHGEKEPPPLHANVVIAVGNCGLYLSGFGVRVEDTVVVTEEGSTVLTEYPYRFEK